MYPSESLASDVNRHLFSTWLDYEPTDLFFGEKTHRDTSETLRESVVSVSKFG